MYNPENLGSIDKKNYFYDQKDPGYFFKESFFGEYTNDHQNKWKAGSLSYTAAILLIISLEGEKWHFLTAFKTEPEPGSYSCYYFCIDANDLGFEPSSSKVNDTCKETYSSLSYKI